MNVLVIKLSSIGDIVHAMPAIAAFRHAVPDASISWAVESSSAEILRGSPLIDRLIEVDTRSVRKASFDVAVSKLKDSMRRLRATHFDVAIDMQGLLKSAAIAKIAGADLTYGFDRAALREPAARFLMHRKVSIPPRTHIIEKNMLIAEAAAGVRLDRSVLEFPIATEEVHRAEADRTSSDAGGDIAILNPAGGWVTKLWPAENFGILADLIEERLGLRAVLTIGPGEDELAERAVAASVRKPAVVRTGLKTFYELCRRARVYVGGDTGPTHLAVAAGTPLVGIFGPTEWWRNGSPRPADISVERVDISCRVDCHRRTCTAWICMDIPVEAVYQAVARRLSKASKTRV